MGRISRGLAVILLAGCARCPVVIVPVESCNGYGHFAEDGCALIEEGEWTVYAETPEAGKRLQAYCGRMER